VRQAANGCELLIDSIRGQTAGFEVHAIANDDVRLNASRGSEQYHATN
jgi:hypothetical protein